MSDYTAHAIMSRHLRQEHGCGIRRISKELCVPESYVKGWIGEYQENKKEE